MTAKPRRVARRPTDHEQFLRVDAAYRLLCVPFIKKSAIKRAFREKFGDLSARTIERYLSRAREQLMIDLWEDYRREADGRQIGRRGP
jgi:hypothetical protein